MQAFVWRNFGMAIPDEWELLQFSRSAETGRCAFADRYQYRLEFDWRIVPAPPDFDRMMSDYRGRLEETGMEDVRDRECGVWRGVQGRVGDRLTTRYGRYFARRSLLAEMVFLWVKRRDPDLERRVLESARPEADRTDARQRWRSFGMDLLVPGTQSLAECTAEPAHQEFDFKSKRRQVRSRFGRWGMVDHWLRRPLEEWLDRRVPKGYVVQRRRSDEKHAHRVALVTGERRRDSVLELVHGPREYSAAAWICPESGRLYWMERTQRPSAGRDDHTRVSLACCASLEETL